MNNVDEMKAFDAGLRGERKASALGKLAAWHRDQQASYSAFGDLQSNAPGRPLFDEQCFRACAEFHAASASLLEGEDRTALAPSDILTALIELESAAEQSLDMRTEFRRAVSKAHSAILRHDSETTTNTQG